MTTWGQGHLELRKWKVKSYNVLARVQCSLPRSEDDSLGARGAHVGFLLYGGTQEWAEGLGQKKLEMGCVYTRVYTWECMQMYTGVHTRLCVSTCRPLGAVRSLFLSLFI